MFSRLLDNYVNSYLVEERAKHKLAMLKKRRIFALFQATIAQRKGAEGILEANQRKMASMFRRSLLLSRTFLALAKMTLFSET